MMVIDAEEAVVAAAAGAESGSNFLHNALAASQSDCV